MKKRNFEAERLADELLMAFGKELGQAREDYCAALMDPDRPDPPVFIDEEKERHLQELRAKHDWDLNWDDVDDLDEDLLEALDSLDEPDLTTAAETAKECGWEEWKNGDRGRWTEFGEELHAGTWEPGITEWNGIEKMTERPHKGGSHRRLRRALILAATLILVMGLAMVVAEGVKLKQSTMHMRETAGESTKITDIEKTKFNVEDFRVTYVPEGYELVEDVVVNEFIRKIKYENREDEGIKIHIAKTKQFGANVDNESVGRIEVLVNDNQAYLFDDGDASFIVWQIGDCTVDVKARLSEEELKQIASHIYVN